MIDIISLLSSDGYVICNKLVIRRFGGDCALLLGELCAEYNYFKMTNQLISGGGFYSTRENIENNIGLKPDVQRKAINLLKEAGIIEVKKIGIPAKNYYFINALNLAKLFESTETDVSESATNASTASSSKKPPLVAVNSDINNNKKLINNYTTINSSRNLLADTNQLTEKPKKKNLFEKCIDLVNEFTTNEELKDTLVQYLKLRLEMKDKPMYSNQWKGLLNKLAKLADNESDMIKIVSTSIQYGWGSFFELKQSYTNNTFNETISKPTNTEVNHNRAVDENGNPLIF